MCKYLNMNRVDGPVGEAIQMSCGGDSCLGFSKYFGKTIKGKSHLQVLAW